MYSSRRAARRFYHAFYCWNRLNARASCKRFASVNFQPSAADAQVEKGTAGPSITKYNVRDGHRPWHERNARTLKDEAETEDFQAHVGKLPLLSSSEKPFDTFKAWERVARYRSDTGGLVQIAVPQHAARVLKEERWERLQSPEFARIELGPIVTTDGESIQSVAVSGTFLELQRTINIIANTKLPDYVYNDPVSLEERPSASIDPYEKVMRRRSTDFCEIETSIPVRHWELVLRKMPHGAIETQFGIKIVTGKVVSLADSNSPGATINMQPLLLSGLPDRMKTTFTLINRFRRSPADPTAVPTTKARSHDVQSSAKHVAQTASLNSRLVMWVPKGPNGEVVARERVREKHDFTMRGCRINVWDEGAFFSIAGPSMSKIRSVSSYIKRSVTEACEHSGVPRVELEERHTEGHFSDQAPSLDSPSAKANTPIVGAKPNAGVHNTSEKAREGPSEDMRRALRALSHPVVLVTSRIPHGPIDPAPRRDNINDRLPFYRGLTVSSFNSVTLNPEVIVSFNVRVPSRTWNAMSQSRSLVAHILTASPSAAALAHEFTKPHERPDEAFWNMQRMGAYITAPKNSNLAPEIKFNNAVLATVRATLDENKCVPVGDHMIVVAKVDKVRFRGEAEKKVFSEADVTDKGLTYAQREYRSVGHEIQPMTMSEAQAQSQQTSAVGMEDQDVSLRDKQAATPQLDGGMIGGVVGADVDSDATDSKPTLSPEQIDVDYFQTIEKDELEPDEGTTSQSDGLHDDAMQEEEEYDFGFASVEDEGPVGIGLQSEPLVEDSAAAREEEGAEDDGAAGSPPFERLDEKDEREETQKRSALNADGT